MATQHLGLWTLACVLLYTSFATANTILGERSNCLHMFEDAQCTTPRGTTTAGRRLDSVVCQLESETCSSSIDFQESYNVSCVTNATASVSVWFSSTTCENKESTQFTAPTNGTCVLAFRRTIPIYAHVRCDVEPYSSNDTAFLVTLGLCALAFFVMLAVFCFIRPICYRIYEPQCHAVYAEENQSARQASISRLGSINRSSSRVRKRPQPSLAAWIGSTISISDDELFSKCGLNGLMYVVFFRIFLKAFALCSLYTFAITVPLTVNGKLDLNNVAQMSISNIEDGSPKLIAFIFSIIVYTCGLLYALNKAGNKFVDYREHYLRTRNVNSRCVLVQDIPADVTGQEGLANYFSGLYDDVESVERYQNLQALEKCSLKRQKVQHSLARALYKQQQGHTPTHREGASFGCVGGNKVDAVSYFQDKLQRLNLEFADLRENLPRSAEYLPTGVITFGSMRSAAIASQVVHAGTPNTYTVSDGVEASDVVWRNLRLNATKRNARRVMIGILTTVLVILWAIPVSFVVSLFSLSSLARIFPSIEKHRDSNSFVGLIEGFLPTIVLSILMSLVPLLMHGLSFVAGHLTMSEIDQAALRKTFWFQVINIFFVSTVLGTALSLLAYVQSNSPLSILQLVGTTMPRTAVFFTQLVIFRCKGGEGLHFILETKAKNKIGKHTQYKSLLVHPTTLNSSHWVLVLFSNHGLVMIVYGFHSRSLFLFVVFFLFSSYQFFKFFFINFFPA
eukprot:m.13257 g.13257  ORF g.13257 m.13257 type:complete len:735 (-) comp5926_c0_seq1:942-3146(-)